MTYRSDYIDEIKVFKMMGQGLIDKVISARLGYSPGRINQLRRIYEIRGHEESRNKGNGEVEAGGSLSLLGLKVPM